MQFKDLNLSTQASTKIYSVDHHTHSKEISDCMTQPDVQIMKIQGFEVRG